MTSVKYIGMDVHTESISIAVRNSTGKIVIESVIETKASTLVQFGVDPCDAFLVVSGIHS
jgi:hypothetical protein